MKTAQDLAVKQVAEQQYLIFNLLAGGKLAWDGGDCATAAAKWEAFLRLPGLDPEIDRVIRPLVRAARARPVVRPSPRRHRRRRRPPGSGLHRDRGCRGAAGRARARLPVAVSGTLSGGGSDGPGGAVIWLKRHGGETPRPAPAKGKVISQRNKTFVPHVLAIPVGTKVDFRNDDAIFHNVFSLSKPNDFDTGLYKQGASYSDVSRSPAPCSSCATSTRR